MMYVVLIDSQNGHVHIEAVYITDYGLPYYTRFPNNVIVPGTLPYIAPEVLQNGESSVTTASDMWAVGCIGYELAIGRRLAENEQKISRQATIGGPEPFDLSDVPEMFGSHVRTVIQSCLNWYPNQRCTAVQMRDYIRNLMNQL